MATAYDCKFIETSVGINHNVDELLVGLLTQIRLKLENPEKSRYLKHIAILRSENVNIGRLVKRKTYYLHAICYSLAWCLTTKHQMTKICKGMFVWLDCACAAHGKRCQLSRFPPLASIVLSPLMCVCVCLWICFFAAVAAGVTEIICILCSTFVFSIYSWHFFPAHLRSICGCDSTENWNRSETYFVNDHVEKRNVAHVHRSVRHVYLEMVLRIPAHRSAPTTIMTIPIILVPKTGKHEKLNISIIFSIHQLLCEQSESYRPFPLDRVFA